MLSSSTQDQMSNEDTTNGYGVFTHFLLEGLKGEADTNNNKEVTIGELIPYVSYEVINEVKNHPEKYGYGKQTPIVSGKFDPALVIPKNR